jgi:hypothetical protein
MSPVRAFAPLAGLAIAAVLIVPAAAFAQSSVPRTPWGAPDLQGVWTGSTLTPMERPAELAGKRFLTEEEVKTMEARAAATQFAEREPAAGDPGTYNQIWFDNGIKVVPDRRTSLIVDPVDGRIPWKAGAREAIGTTLRIGPFHGPEDLDTGERCLTDGLPMLRLGYNPNSRIVQSPDHIVIANEMFHDHRVIPIGDRPHSPVRQWNGDTRARWEGDTLVVETVGYIDRTKYRWANTWKAPSETMKLTEKFRRVDAETLEYEFTLEDPSKFTRPWTAILPLTTNQASRGVAVGEMYEYACHEGNHSVINVLSGARADEKAAASGSR